MTGHRIHARPRITPRLREVLILVAAGRTDCDIATQLGIGLGTVHSHVKALRIALTARNRTHVVARAYQEGLLPADRRVAS